jgi:hypothetical protein
MSAGPVSSSPNQCVAPQPEAPDTSGPSEDRGKQFEELVKNAPHDVVEAACGEIPFVPDSWCDFAGDIAQDIVEASANMPPELQWNLESS